MREGLAGLPAKLPDRPHPEAGRLGKWAAGSCSPAPVLAGCKPPPGVYGEPPTAQGGAHRPYALSNRGMRSKQLLQLAGGPERAGAGDPRGRRSPGSGRRTLSGAGRLAEGPLPPPAPGLAPRNPARLPRGLAAAVPLSIQEERGAPGRPGGNYDSQDALRGRCARLGPIRAREWARAATPLAGGRRGEASEGALRVDWLEARGPGF